MTLEDILATIFSGPRAAAPPEPPPGEIARRALANEMPPSALPDVSDPTRRQFSPEILAAAHKASGLPTPPASTTAGMPGTQSGPSIGGMRDLAVRDVASPGVPYAAPSADSQRLAGGQTAAPGSMTTGSVPARPAPNLSLPDTSPTFGEQLAGFFAGLSGPASSREYNARIERRHAEAAGRLAKNQTFKALIAKGEDPATAEAAVYNPALMQALVTKHWGAPKRTFGQVGSDNFGNKIMGWIDPVAQTATPLDGRQSGTGPGDFSKLGNGEDFLKNLDKPTADTVRAISEGRMQFPSGFALKTPYWQKMIQMVSQYDPSFDAVNYNARAKTRNDFTSGKSAQNITSFNTALQHLDTLDKSIEGLGNSSVPLWNAWVANPVAGQFDPEYQVALKNFQASRTALTDELTRAFRAAGGNVHDIEEWEKNISAADTPAQLHAVAKQAVELLRGRLEAIADQYNRGMGTTKDPLELLSPKAQETVRRITGDSAASVGSISGSGRRPSAAQPARNATDALDQAREAIARGADRNAVMRRLRENGVDPGQLLGETY